MSFFAGIFYTNDTSDSPLYECVSTLEKRPFVHPAYRMETVMPGQTGEQSNNVTLWQFTCMLARET